MFLHFKLKNNKISYDRSNIYIYNSFDFIPNKLIIYYFVIY